MPHVIVWDIETVPDLKGFAAARGHDGKTDDEIRAELQNCDETQREVGRDDVKVELNSNGQDPAIEGSWLPERVFRGARSGGEARSAMSDDGVYVSTDRAAARQWGAIKDYRITHQPRLLDLGDFSDRRAREFVVTDPWEIDKVDPDELTREEFDIEAGSLFMQNRGVALLHRMGFDGYRLGRDAFLLGDLSDYAQAAE
jgi:hypothetical protein